MSQNDYDTQSVSFFIGNNITPPSSTGGFANQMTIQLTNPMKLDNSEVSLASLFCYYSWFNITSAFANNTLSYTLPNGAGTGWGTSYPVFTDSNTPTIIGDGLYTINDINNALQFTFQYNGHYFTDSNGNNVYPITLAVNPTGYNVTITLAQLYHTLPTGWSVPGSALGSSPFTATGSTVDNFAVNTVARLVIPTTSSPAGSYIAGQSSMSKLLGILPGNYPTASNPSTVTSAQFQYAGTIAPQIAPIDSINVCCNLVNASNLTPVAASCIYNFAPDSTAGTLLSIQPINQLWYPVTNGQYNQITLSLQTSFFTPLPVKDPQMSATLLIRSKRLPDRQDQLKQQVIAAPHQPLASPPYIDPLTGGSGIGFKRPRIY